MNNNNSLLRHLAWLVVAIVGAAALGVVALRRGEAINALWIVVAAVAIYLVAYRYYSLFIASKVMQLDPNRATPAVLNNDGLTTSRPTSTSSSATTSPPSPAPVRWSVRSCRADGLPARHPLADRRRSPRRRGAGLHGPVHLQPPQRPLAGRAGARGNGPGGRDHRAVRRLPDHDHHPRGARADRGEGSGRQPLGHVHRPRDHSHRAVHGRLHALHPPRPDRRDLDHRGVPPARFDLARRAGRGQSGMGAAFHLQWNPDHLDADRLRRRRLGTAGVAAAGAARLPVDLPQDRHHHRPGDRHPDRHAGTEDAGPDPVHRRHRPGLERQPVPVPVHHHRLRRGVRLPRADLLGDHAEAAQPSPTPATSATAAC